MKPIPPSGRLRVPPGARFAFALLALTALSCGRSNPVAPHASVPGSSSHPIRPALVQEYLGQVALMPREGVNVYRLASDFGARLAPGSGYACIRFVPAAGETPDALAARLAADPRVVVAERNAVVETAETRQESYASDDGFGSLQNTVAQPAVGAIELGLAHRFSRGSGVRVAVLDTGVDPTHRWLRSRLDGGIDLVDYDADYTDRRDGLDTDGDGHIDEAYGHGTHVAGIVALAAPGARLLVARVLDADGRGDIAAVTAGLRWALDAGADVINLSLGMLVTSRCIETVLAEASQRGVIVVASAGNLGAEHPREYPASSPHAIAVAASDAWARAAGFTSFGTHVAITAPGVAVRSAYPGNAWRLWSGTSMSAPFVSGAAALLRSRHPDWRRNEVMARLAGGATPIRSAAPIHAGKLGAGMLNVGRALASDRFARGLDGK